MKVKNRILTLLILSSASAAAIVAINEVLKITATSRNLLADDNSLCYKWRLGNIHYTKTGSGKPLLLIHDLTAASSGYEWSHVIAGLQEEYTVYTIDLLGCGRSEKVNLTYTNYLYVQLISDFIKNVIGHRTSVVASGESCSIPIMACAHDPSLFDQIMLLNPLSISDYGKIPGKMAKIYKGLIDLPVSGTLLYNIVFSRKILAEYFQKEAFYNPFCIKPTHIEHYLEASHLGNSPKSTYASVRCNYTKCNISNALRKIDNSIYLAGGEGIDDIENRLEAYKTFNSAIETFYIPAAKQLPQLEAPEKVIHLIRTYIN